MSRSSLWVDAWEQSASNHQVRVGQGYSYLLLVGGFIAALFGVHHSSFCCLLLRLGGDGREHETTRLSLVLIEGTDGLGGDRKPAYLMSGTSRGANTTAVMAV